METQRKRGPVTIKGAWHAARRVARESGVSNTPSLKEFARAQARHLAAGTETAKHPIVLDAHRWLQAKRPGGTDAERKARRDKRREQQGIRLVARAARKGKGSLKPSGEGKKKKGKGGD